MSAYYYEQMRQEMVLPLKAAKSLNEVGGKAKSLGEMIRAGFNVPGGFVVTTKSKMKMSPELEDEIIQKFSNLGSKYVAVRSSAVAEDSKSAAWAGQFDTFLNTNRQHLVGNVKKCWASASSVRANAYAKEKGLKSGAVAVIVQKMVPADVAGVAFSVHPVTQNQKQIVIEAVRGLGEKLVSGATTPDTYIVHKETGEIIEFSLSTEKPILANKDLREIAKQVTKIERVFGFPVDIEWAYAKHQLYILQSRPITTLQDRTYDLPPLPLPPRGVKYALTVPQSVLFADLSLRGNLRKSFNQIGMDYEPEYILIDAGGAMSWNYNRDNDFIKALKQGESVPEAVSKYIKLMEVTSRNLEKASLTLEKSSSNTGTEELTIQLNTNWDAYELHSTSLFTFWNVEYLLTGYLLSLLQKYRLEQDIKNGMARFFTPYKPNYFVLERQAFGKITRRFGSKEQFTIKNAPPSLVGALRKHSQTFGFLLAPFNLGAPPSVESLMKRLNNRANIGDDKTTRVESLDDLPRELKELAVITRKFAFWKSNRLDIYSLADSKVYQSYIKISNKLNIPPNELFLMTRDEINHSLIMDRVVVDEENLTQRQIAYCLLLSHGTINFYKPTVVGEKGASGKGTSLVRGVVASDGKLRGKVRVILSDKDLVGFKEKEILVTPMTRPEYGVALDRAAAFITDEGGILCHAAIISREMHKPCIVGTGNATKLLKTGDVVDVNADLGIVRIIG